MQECRDGKIDGLVTRQTKDDGLINFVFNQHNEVSSTIIQSAPQDAYWYDFCPSSYYCVDDTGSVKPAKFIQFNQKLNFDDARDVCKSIGGDLATIHSQEDNDLIMSLIGEGAGIHLIGLTR